LAAAVALAAPVAPAGAQSASRQAFDRAFASFQSGDLRTARVELLNALKEDQNNAPARLLYARVLMARGDGVAAQTEIERAIRAGAPRDRTHHLLANALFLQRKFSEARDLASRPDIPPQFAAYAARMRGRANAALNNDPAARADFERAARLAPRNVEVQLDLARYLASKRDIPRAVAAVDRALAVQPGHPQALLLKGDFTRATQGLAAALPFFDRALRTDPNNLEALLERAATYGDLGRENDARADIAKVKGLAPNHPLALYLEAVLAARKGQWQEAQGLLGQTKGMLDAYPPAMALSGMVSFQLGNLGQAFETFSRLVAQNPQNLAARRMLGLIQLRRGDPRAAVATLKPLEALPRLDAGTLSIIGSAYAGTGDMTRAQQFLERAAQQAPGQAQVGTQLAMTRYAQGDVAAATAGLNEVLAKTPNSLEALVSLTTIQLQRQQFKEGQASADRIVKAYPKLPIGYNLRGAARLAQRDVAGAEADFRAALAQKGDYADARRNLAQLLMLTNRADEARREAQALIAQNPKDVRAMLLMADLAGMRNNLNERIDWLRRAATESPNAFAPKAALVRTYVAANQPDRALTEATALVRAMPNDPRALQILAGAQMGANQPAAAVESLQKIVAANPNSVGAHVGLARAQTVANRLDDARTSYAAALRLPPAAETEVALVDLIGLDVRAKRFDQALANANQLKTRTRNKAGADRIIGDVQLAAGRVPQAIASYEASRRQANTAAINVAIARAQMAANNPAAAGATLAAYARANPKDATGRAALADFHLQRQDWRAAIATYEAMRKDGIATTDPGVLNNLAYAYGKIGDRRALQLAADAHRRAPASPAIQDTYGLLLVQMGGDARRGLTLLQEAAKGAPRDPNIRFNLAQAYRANNMRAEARREAELALRTPGLQNPGATRQFLAQLGG
jgi:putative PEP-CTERM system TPR-repeat lipoprotein